MSSEGAFRQKERKKPYLQTGEEFLYEIPARPPPERRRFAYHAAVIIDNVRAENSELPHIYVANHAVPQPGSTKNDR